MQMKPLGRTGIEVSALCLGTMTFGSQTRLEEAHEQIDMALVAGINFIDTAEMYPVNPVRAETIGRSERIVGRWIEKTKQRDKIVLATKHSGEGLGYVRDGALISSETIHDAIDGSLRRLNTDYIDLYQFHWPNRGSYMFRQNWTFDPTGQNKVDTLAHIEDALGALQKEVERGRIRAFGLSNESAWGTAQWLRVSEDNDLPRVASIQNEYSMLCRLYDTDLAELSANEDVGLLAFSPLAAGLLTGKYQGGAVPDGSRMSLVDNLGGRKSDRVFDVVDVYLKVAQKHGLDPIHMALAWCMQRPFVASAIFGATQLAQLEHIITGKDLVLSQEVIDDINVAHRAHPMPY